MRDKLIELMAKRFKELHKDGDWNFNEMLANVADYLIKKGVIVPPCKVGETVYYPWIYNGQCGIAFNEVESIKIYVNGLPIAVVEDWRSDMPMPISFTVDDFGKSVFLTKSEAEQKLKEMRGDNDL